MRDKNPSKTVDGIYVTNTYFSEMPTPELDCARKSMAIVSVNMYADHPYVGGGVVVRYKESKYFVTASHSIGDVAYRQIANHKVYWTKGTVYLKNLKMLYSVPIAQKSELPIGDIAIFEFPFATEPVELGELSYPLVAISMGFPVDAIDMWRNSRLPVARAGLAYRSRRIEPSFTPYGTIDVDKFVDEITAEVLTAGGSSGGGLFDQQGNLLGICRGYKTGNPEWGEFYAVKPIFEALEL